MMSTQDLILSIYEKYLLCQGITIDSRQVLPKSLFFSIRGDHFNGNAFAKEALERGASYAVIDEKKYQEDERYILVENALEMLKNLAIYHRKRFTIPVIGITGSCGKTTTKELVYAVLRQRYRTIATPKSFNNEIGVPLGVLAIQSHTEIVVIELGASRIGEIAMLCQIAMPTHGLITNIGPSHLEGFGSMEGVLRAKSELYDYLFKHHGTIFVNTTDPVLSNMAKRCSHVISYPQSRDFCHTTFVNAMPFVEYENESKKLIKTQLLGNYNFYNIAAALCIAKYFSVLPHQADQAMQHYIPMNNRGQLFKKGYHQIVLDAYNANPVTIKGALQLLQNIPNTYKVVILGDMLELGTESLTFHKEIVQFTIQGGYDEMLFCGKHMSTVCQYNARARYFVDKASLINHISHKKYHQPTTVLIKGSRALRLETLVDVLLTTLE